MMRFLIKIIILSIHIITIGVIYFIWHPIMQWYLNKTPALGVDLYLSITYLAYQLRNFSLPFNSFKDIWFAGYPLMKDYPQLTFYLMLPFAHYFEIGKGVQIFAVSSILLLTIFSYLMFYQLSKNFGLALLLSILILFSPNMYGALIWAGSIPYFFTQALFPLSLLMGVKYLEKPSMRYLAAMALVTAFAILINPLGVAAFMIPSSLIIIVVGGLVSPIPLKRIFLHTVVYLTGLIFASFSYTYDSVNIILTILSSPITSIGVAPSSVKSPVQAGANGMIEFYKTQIPKLYSNTNWGIFTMLGIGVALLIIALFFPKTPRRILKITPFLLIALYTAAHPILNLSNSLLFFWHDIYRAFWSFPIAVAALAAACFGVFSQSIVEGVASLSKGISLLVNLLIVLSSSIFFVILTFLIFNSQILGLLNMLDKYSELSSAFPEAMSIDLSQDRLNTLKKQVVPSFIDPNEQNKRLYDSDATVSIWWNSLFKMPMARGYIDPPVGTQSRGGFFWLDIAIANDSLVHDFKASEEEALANGLFLIDWDAINYYEGGRGSSKGPSSPPSSYLIKNHVFDKEEFATTSGAVLKFQTLSGKPELIMDLQQSLHYYKVADKYASPILHPTNSAAIIVFSSDYVYEDILRMLALYNLNSRKLIPIKGGSIDNVSLEQLSNFDAVFLSGYSYKNQKKVFDMLEKYVRGGGKVFIDTGDDIKDSNSDKLPAVFPIARSQRKVEGREWELRAETDPIMDGVEISKFGPLIFNNADWKISTPKDDSDLRNGAKVILRHKGKPVLVERDLGNGKVIWSGFNLPYHYNQYKSASEARLFLNILNQFVQIQDNPIPSAKQEWIKPERVIISTEQKPRGILFKEEFYDGWKAQASSLGGKSLDIYKAGPTFPGFMYVPTKDLPEQPLIVEFTYSGEPKFWIATFINILAVVILLEIVLFESKLSMRVVRPVLKLFKKRVGSWWDKEDV